MLAAFEGDSETFEILAKRGFIHRKGCIYAPYNHVWTAEDHAAVDYLVDEWDWAYMGEAE